jgi:Zn-dependent M32 family carboxypeptidase
MAEPDEAQVCVRTKPASSQYQALLEASEFIALHRDLPTLFHDLKKGLPRLVNFRLELAQK